MTLLAIRQSGKSMRRQINSGTSFPPPPGAAQDPQREIRNPKSEGRNPKVPRDPKAERSAKSERLSTCATPFVLVR